MFTGLENGLGLDIVVWLQAHGNAVFDALAAVFNVTGGSMFAIVVVPLVYWSLNKRLGLQMLFMLLVGALVSSMIKEIAQTPRPFVAHPGEVDGQFTAGGYGFPSGHVMNTMMFWLPLVVWIGRRWAWYAYGVLVLLVAWSRVYGGVHYPQDVVGSLVIGAPLAWLYARRDPEPAALYRPVMIGAFLVLPLVLAPVIRGYEDGITALGVILGVGVGLILEQRYVAFVLRGSYSQRALRYAVGAALMLAILFGLRAFFGAAAPQYVLRMLRYATVTVFALAVWPAVWPRLGL